jgi:hypothetical protein
MRDTINPSNRFATDLAQLAFLESLDKLAGGQAEEIEKRLSNLVGLQLLVFGFRHVVFPLAQKESPCQY